ncbi:aldo-keto reductase family 1 member A1-A [Procambarus clarkii]|uniref:aldo-keto reductase family 1 member A1-A n=1 Tax=Procambarus clarkii TaxID=6728 RepID=UPI001E672498|nr:aldo-keto reductase family 1 member A1-A-like [Procambarus clarkii]
MSTKVPTITMTDGRKMPAVGLGTWMARDEEMRAALTVALECGYRHVDTAYYYQNEKVIGQVLHEWLSSGKVTREELFITTKLPEIGIRASDVSRFLKKSLEWLQLTYVDLYLVHKPYSFLGKDDDDINPVGREGDAGLDLTTNIEDVWKAMEEQVDAGRAKSIGLSNFNSVQTKRIMKMCRVPPANMQVEIHAYHQQKELRALYSSFGVSVCAYGPIGAPYLYSATSDHPALVNNPVVTAIASRLKRTPGQVLIRFLLQHGMAVVPKSSNPERIRQNIEVFDFKLTSEDMSALEALDRGPDGKIYCFEDCKSHPEYPFHIPF